jgi:hypothetical protein
MKIQKEMGMENFPPPMPQQLKPYSLVDGYTNLIRDDKTNAILNTNYNEYENYKYLKSIKDKENARIENLENNLEDLKSDINEIKNLLRNLANGS